MSGASCLVAMTLNDVRYVRNEGGWLKADDGNSPIIVDDYIEPGQRAGVEIRGAGARGEKLGKME